MAKKKQEMSSEELLAEALVKPEDWPYQVPGNWVWTRLGSVTEVIMGQSPKGQDTTDNDSYIGLIGGAADMGEHYPKVSRYTMKPTKISQINDVIISIRATLGRPIISDGKYCLGRGVSAIRSNLLTHKFILFYILNFENKFYEIATGTTFAQISKINLENMSFPLPPLAEQQRIVDRIESLFDQLDQAKDLIQESLDSFETRKAAILHQAFTGQLTKKWRAAHGVGMESWEETVVGKVCKCIVPGRDKPKSFTGNIPWITIPNIKDDFISNTSSTLFLTIDEVNEVRAKIIPINSVVMTCVGRFGITAIVIDECVINQQLHAFLPSTMINNKFLMHNIRYLKDYMEEKATSTTIAYLNKTACNSLPINLPTMKEQEEIVRILDDLFEKEQNAKDLCDLIEQIEAIKKTILGKAFRGEMGTNEAGEESAVVLLEKVIDKNILFIGRG